MGKIAFLPFSVGSGLVAGMIARRAFALTWRFIDEQDPPKPEHRDVKLGKLAAAVTLEAAIFALTRGLADRGARAAFEHLTGSWPGDEEPERS
jgi:hypothetical protein